MRIFGGTGTMRFIKKVILAALIGLLFCAAAHAQVIRPLNADYAMSIVKLVFLVVLIIPSLYVCNWIVGDLGRLLAEPLLWSIVAPTVMVVSVLTAVLVPWFYVGCPLGVLMMVVMVGLYARHRNRLVPAKLHVFTRQHFARVRDRLAGRAPEETGDGPTTAVHPVTFLGADDMPLRRSGQSEADIDKARITRELFEKALGRRSAELGLTYRPSKGGRLRLRIDGIVVDDGMMPAEEAAVVFAEVKRMAGLDPAEARKPQSGRFKAVMSGRKFDVRVRTAGSVRGEQMHALLIDMVEASRRLPDLGVSKEQMADIQAALDAGTGLVLASAPAHTGLTSTLHAVLWQFDRYMKTVAALEPQVNIDVENVQQIEVPKQVASDGGLLKELESLLRTEPNVVMIDDLADDATARRVIEAAREHLIIVGVQALDVGRAVSRFIGMVQDRKGVAEVLRLVTSQRLARMLCRQCKEAYRPRPEFLRKANLTKQNVDVLYRVPLEREEKRGKVVVCPGCENAGFIDRTGFFEVMPIDAEAREMIAEGKTMADVRLHARKRGSRSLQEAGLRRVIEGLTSVDEVLRVIQKPS